MSKFERVPFWHKTILPATFEDEVSQYEVLAKLIFKINEIIDFLNNLGLDGEIVADKLRKGRKIQLINEVLGSTIFDGSKDVVINALINPEFVNELKQEILDIVNDMIQENKISDEYIKNLINQEIGKIDYTELMRDIENLIDQKISEIEIEPYELPIASVETLGGIKVGSGLGITEDGTLYVITEEPEEPAPPIDEEHYELGYLDYDFDEENKTAVVNGFRTEEYNRDMIIPNNVIKGDITYKVIGIKDSTYGVFYPKAIDSIRLGDNLEFIGNDAFSGIIKKDINLILPTNLKRIEGRAFCGAKIYGTLELPSSLEKIEFEGFGNNPNLKTVIFNNNVELIGHANQFYPFDGNPTINLTDNVGTWDRKINGSEEGFGWYKRKV